MKKLELQAYGIEDAKMQAFKEGITVIADATNAWKSAGSPILTQELNMFAADYLDSKGYFNFEGAGIIIVAAKGAKSEIQKPFNIINARRKGKCKTIRSVQIRKKSNNEVVAVAPNKTSALKLAKKLIRTYKEDLYGKTVYVAKDIDFEAKYDPSVREILGKYIIFGTEESDVRICKQKRRDFQ